MPVGTFYTWLRYRCEGKYKAEGRFVALSVEPVMAAPGESKPIPVFASISSAELTVQLHEFLRKFIMIIIDLGLIENGSLGIGDVEFIYFYAGEASMFEIVTRVGGIRAPFLCNSNLFLGIIRGFGWSIISESPVTNDVAVSRKPK